MQRSLFLLITSVVAAGCGGDDSCGPGDATQSGLFLSSADVTINFGNVTAGLNNDCPDPMAPEGVVSMTLQGTQVDGSGRVTLCVSRPDKLADGVPLGGTSVQIVDLKGDLDGCMYDFESLRPVAGDVSASGLCDDGASSAGFALTVDGSVSLDRTCPTMSDIIAVSFAGTVAVAAD
jgi:hypothetical protein